MKVADFREMYILSLVLIISTVTSGTVLQNTSSVRTKTCMSTQILT